MLMQSPLLLPVFLLLRLLPVLLLLPLLRGSTVGALLP